jgi:hypothetical protein
LGPSYSEYRPTEGERALPLARVGDLPLVPHREPKRRAGWRRSIRAGREASGRVHSSLWGVRGGPLMIV